MYTQIIIFSRRGWSGGGLNKTGELENSAKSNKQVNWNEQGNILFQMTSVHKNSSAHCKKGYSKYASL